MQNEKLGRAAALLCAAATFAFLILLVAALFADNQAAADASYLVCIFLAFGYLGMTAAFAKAARPARRVYTLLSLLFGVLYAGFIFLVYFTQLTVVRQGNAAPEILAVLAFDAPGSWLFALDLVGYGMMSLSAACLGLSLQTQDDGDRALRFLCLGKSVFALCMFVPLLPLAANAGKGGVIVLLLWCLYFLPIALLAARSFHKRIRGAKDRGAQVKNFPVSQ